MSKKPKKPKDPHKPKMSQSAYFLFNNDIRASIRKKYPEKKPTERAKFVAAKWKEMSDIKKKPYNDKSAILKAEYRDKMEEYKQSQHYVEYQKKLKEWKQQCMNIENGVEVNQQKMTQRRKNWIEFKERRENEWL
eukprot:380402_1